MLAPLEFDPNRYQMIDPLPSSHFFDLVETFTHHLPHGPVRRQLKQTCCHTNRFAQFRDTLKQAPEIRQEWQHFYQGRLENFAQQWLERHNIDAVLA